MSNPVLIAEKNVNERKKEASFLKFSRNGPGKAEGECRC